MNTGKFSQSRKNNGMGFVKGIILFFLWMSCIFFMARAFDITPIARNVQQILQNILLTSDGQNTSATGVFIEWLSGNAWFKGDLTIDSIYNAIVLGTNGSGKLTAATSGQVYNFISWFVFGWTAGATGAMWATGANWSNWVTWAMWATGATGTQWATWANWTNWVTGAVWATGAQWIQWTTWANWTNGIDGINWATGFLQTWVLWAMPFRDGNDWITNNTNIFNTWFNVGIATILPTAKLDINGNLRIRNVPYNWSLTWILVIDASGFVYRNDLSFGVTWPQWVTWATGANGTNWADGINGVTWAIWATGATWPQWIQWVQWPIWATGANGTNWVDGINWATWTAPNHDWSWTYLRFENPFGWRWSFVNLIWPQWSMWASWYAVVINIVQTWAAWTNGQCANTGNIISFYADTDYNLTYTIGIDTLLWSTIMCSDWATWPQWIQWVTGAMWATWAQWIQWVTGAIWATWVAWVNGSDWVNWATGATWPQWATGANWVDGINWATGATWPQWATWANWTNWADGINWATGFLQTWVLWAMPFRDGNDWITNSTNIFNTWFNIGIATILPTAKLDINGNLRIRNVAYSGSLTWILVIDASWFVYRNDSSLLVGPTWSQWIQWVTGAIWATGAQWIQWTAWAIWATGANGIDWITGAIWATGATWPQWIQWIQWIQGLIGLTWLQWIQGIQWIQWVTGAIWATGAAWVNGIDWVNWATGATWPQWIQWVTGAMWATGAQWIQWTAWAIWATGANGIDWITGAVWATGATGLQWIQWVTGANGIDWITGAVWATGATWPQWIQWIQWTAWAIWATGFLQAGVLWSVPYRDGAAWITSSSAIFTTWWNVWIWTISPTQALTVSGNINVTPGYNIYDGWWNPYLTGIWSLASSYVAVSDSGTYFEANSGTYFDLYSGDYYTTNPLGYITTWNESDPVWSAASTNYYTKTFIDNFMAWVAGGLLYKGIVDYSTWVLPTNTQTWFFYLVSVSWSVNGLILYERDMLVANKTLATPATWDFDVIRNNVNVELDPVYGVAVVWLSNWYWTYYSWGQFISDRRYQSWTKYWWGTNNPFSRFTITNTGWAMNAANTIMRIEDIVSKEWLDFGGSGGAAGWSYIRGSTQWAVRGLITIWIWYMDFAGINVTTSRLRINTASWYVGINNASPSEALDVAGNIKTNGNIKLSATGYIGSNPSQILLWYNGYVGIGTTTPSQPLEVWGAAKLNGDLLFASPSQIYAGANNWQIYLWPSGTVSIGDNTTTYKLNVKWDVGTKTVVLTTNSTWLSTNITGQIIFSWGNFYGNNGSTRLQLN